PGPPRSRPVSRCWATPSRPWRGRPRTSNGCGTCRRTHGCTTSPHCGRRRCRRPAADLGTPDALATAPAVERARPDLRGGGCAARAAATVSIITAASLSIAQHMLPSAPVGAPNPLPAVAAMPQPPYEASTAGLPTEIATNIAYGQVSSIHPYLLQDGYSRERTLSPMRLAVLENEHMRAEFALDLGGRLVRLLDRTTGSDLVYRNAIFQPANLALRGAWFSGGAEWNIGMRGHWPLTCDPLYAAEVTGDDGEPVLRM